MLDVLALEIGLGEVFLLTKSDICDLAPFVERPAETVPESQTALRAAVTGPIPKGKGESCGDLVGTCRVTAAAPYGPLPSAHFLQARLELWIFEPTDRASLLFVMAPDRPIGDVRRRTASQEQACPKRFRLLQVLRRLLHSLPP